MTRDILHRGGPRELDGAQVECKCAIPLIGFGLVASRVNCLVRDRSSQGRHAAIFALLQDFWKHSSRICALVLDLSCSATPGERR